MLPMSHPAVELVTRLAAERGVAPRLRVRVVAGGCSGLTWDLELGAAARDDDHRRETDGVAVLVDPVSAPYLQGARVDVGPPAANGLRAPLVGADAASAVLVAGLVGRSVCGCGESIAPA